MFIPIRSSCAEGLLQYPEKKERQKSRDTAGRAVALVENMRIVGMMIERLLCGMNLA